MRHQSKRQRIGAETDLVKVRNNRKMDFLKKSEGALMGYSRTEAGKHSHQILSYHNSLLLAIFELCGGPGDDLCPLSSKVEVHTLKIKKVGKTYK